MGSGLSAVGLAEGAEVTEDHLALLLGAGRHPVNGGKLGHAYPRSTTVAERVAARLRQLPAEVARGTADRITAEEAARPTRRAVAGYDLTFSVPKSVSAWWALADDATRRGIVEVHHAAVRDVLALMERDVAATRAGAKGPHGGVLQLDVDGLIAAAFDHWDSRAGDPQVHTHVGSPTRCEPAATGGGGRSTDGRCTQRWWRCWSTTTRCSPTGSPAGSVCSPIPRSS
ncbi:MobF family relaxase [Euzebya pacifica]|uniref:MobF family relaxase n=1 Tax=Euzebya pacifica TaxID=1608957 RepID=UPI001C1FC81D